MECIETLKVDTERGPFAELMGDRLPVVEVINDLLGNLYQVLSLSYSHALVRSKRRDV